ncbi:protein kinase domain-containing protein [Phenylobacterium sp.]|uniref:protein kinase domain-containing protein n=1 Tax=Phenylobacterium sp. TaxID=1871053 RepID=UPI00286CDD8E|nr:protein kinase [Phenylobacterium sp.]
MLDLVGRFQVQERIGEGAMADVYRAYDPSIRRALAIKVLKDQYREDPEYASRFLREAKAAGALSHPNIVTIYDVGEVNGYPYIAMELLDGEPLNEVMSRTGRLTNEQVLDISHQLADALRYAHTLGVVHRDIKPSNIMLGADGHSVKILDFGIARVAEADGLLDADHLKTQIGQVLGTPRYMSPEQALGRDIDGRSDLFSLGVVMYEMITGQRAFAGGSAATLALQVTQQDPEPIAKLAPESPRGLQFIINKLLAKRPERRFANGAQLADALRREQSVYATVKAEGTAKRYLPMQVRLTLLMGVVTAAVLAIAVGFVVVRQGEALRRTAMTSGAAMTSFVATNAALTAADNATLPPESRDWLPVQAFVGAASADKNVVGIVVVDADGVVRGATDPALIDTRYRPPQNERVESSQDDLRITSFTSPKAGGAFRFIKPITYAGRPIGKVDVSLSRSELESAATLTRGLLIMLGIVVLGVVAVATYVVTRMLAQPLRRLRKALDDGAAGDLDFRISHNRSDEFGELFDAFNRFSATMQERLDNVEAIALETPPAEVAAEAEAPVEADNDEQSAPAPRSAFAAPEADDADDDPLSTHKDDDRTMIGGGAGSDGRN